MRCSTCGSSASAASAEPARTPDRPLDAPLIPDGLDAAIAFVRHGESTFIHEGRFQGQAETPLTETGRRQAALVATRLATPAAAPALPLPDAPPLEVVHSPLARARETAGSIAAAVGSGDGAAARPEPGFVEIGQGEWEGLHREEIVARYGERLAAWRRTPTLAWAPGGESLADVAGRVRPALARTMASLAAAGPRGTIDRDLVAGYDAGVLRHPWSIVVAHDGVFKICLLTLFDLPLERFWMWTMDLAAITVVEFQAGRAVLRAHNLTGHLATLLDEAAVAETEQRSRTGAL
jgi:probable phosphoglycerate mutase